MADSKKRTIDAPTPFFTNLVFGLDVKCPHCGGKGTVSKDKTCFLFQCEACGKRQNKERMYHRYQVSEICTRCNRHFRFDITDESQKHFKALNVYCTHCNSLQQGKVQKIPLQYTLQYDDIEKGIDPYFGYPLYYQTEFDGKVIWANNRQHLVYLIDYVEAKIRETRIYHLPKFILSAKNRTQIVKLLKRLL